MADYFDHCGACRYFANEDAAGWGWCDLRDESVSCSKSCIHGEKRKWVKSPIVEGRLVSDRTFALRLKSFVTEVQANDPMSEEERDYLLGVADRLLAYQAATATDADEIDYLKQNGIGSQNEESTAPQYTAQCETCMRKIASEVLEVCKDSADENRHCQTWNHEKQDQCLYKIWWDKYPESYWRTILTAEQFAKAKSLNQNEE